MRCGRLVLELRDGVIVAELRGLAEEEGVHGRVLPLAVDRHGALRTEEEEEVSSAGDSFSAGSVGHIHSGDN